VSFITQDKFPPIAIYQASSVILLACTHTLHKQTDNWLEK